MEDTHGHARDRIEAACRLLEEDLARELPLAELARRVHLSPFHFHRLFRGLTGETVGSYRRRLRLERSAHRLRHTEQDILAIALDHGYGSHEAFTRAFRRHFGQNPSEYRDQPSPAPTPCPSGRPELEVRIEPVEPMTVAAVRHVGPYSEVGSAWSRLMRWGWTRMLFGQRTTLGLCHDDPEVTEANQVRYDACLVVSPGTRTRGDVELRELAGGDFAVATHVGPYTTLGETYAALFAQIVTSPVAGRRWQLGDPPSHEIYANDPRSTPPEELVTEIRLPVRSV